MADEATSTTETPEVETPEQTDQAKTTGDIPPEVKAALRKANKEAETLRLKLQEFEDRDKTEAQRLTDRADAAEKRAAELEVKALRLEVAGEKGLTPAQARRLVGSTREELEADAAELLETFRPAADDTVAATVASLDLGPRGSSSVAASSSPAGDFAKFIKRQTG